ncbi:hypothetical protein GCM10009682_42640 [Luedemannella flava]|uniref:MoaD/ThiS family protein n=2 Tax=Luedemannella flava TaxID=349316 RepID=A0ABP4YNE9_9ACTN
MPGRDAGMPTVTVELAEESTTLREVIRLAVREQVASLGDDQGRCRSLLDRHYLTEAEIRAGAATGAVKLPSRLDTLPELDAEIERALRAFERRAFVVFVGGRQIERLDDAVTVRPGEHVVFLRLVALVGG